MNIDTFEYHLEKAVECLLKSSNIDPIKSPQEAKAHIKNNLYTMVNFYIKPIVDKLITK